MARGWPAKAGSESSKPEALVGTMVLTRAFGLERVKGIEPSLSAWEADVLPLNYTRIDAVTRVPAS
jgi:hypothetical protein